MLCRADRRARCRSRDPAYLPLLEWLQRMAWLAAWFVTSLPAPHRLARVCRCDTMRSYTWNMESGRIGKAPKDYNCPVRTRNTERLQRVANLELPEFTSRIDPACESATSSDCAMMTHLSVLF